MSELQLSRWSVERFGAAAADLTRAVPAAIQRAHELALDAHVASEVSTNDVYGSALWVNQHEQLVEYTREIPGIDARRPAGMHSRFSLVVVNDTKVVLYMWRFATDHKTSYRTAKMRPPISDLRRSLLTLTPHVYDDGAGQLPFDGVEIDAEAAEAARAEEEAVLRELEALGRVVTVGFASNPAGLIELGWGDCELLDDHGYVRWTHWETLPRAGRFGEGEDGNGQWVPRRPGGGPAPARFDADATLDDDFGLRARSPLDVPPISEPERDRPDSGSGDESL
ncbi:hypothetical protein AB0H36_27870 [Kribbella sp. NPDC050820]|uniref:hypothetical protein n=1 Tax=Kribbella sp. NPDC050820 TaxID=3155408 RepID=UPI003400D7B6